MNFSVFLSLSTDKTMILSAPEYTGFLFI